MSKAKTVAKKPTKASSIPTLEAVLGIEPATQFQFAGRVFEARRLSLSDQIRLNAVIALDEDKSMPAHAEVLSYLLTARLVVGEELTADEVLNTVDIHTATRLLLLLQGQFTPRHDLDGEEGK